LLDYTLIMSGVGGPTLVSGTFSFPDWFSQTSAGDVNGLGRVGAIFGSSADNYDTVGGNNFSLYTIALTIPTIDQSLTLEGVTIGFDSANTGLASGDSAVVVGVSAGGPAPVPEPTPLVLAAAGVGLLAILRRRS
jgi:MYXO-CTERM domain-containing protein